MSASRSSRLRSGLTAAKLRGSLWSEEIRSWVLRAQRRVRIQRRLVTKRAAMTAIGVTV